MNQHIKFYLQLATTILSSLVISHHAVAGKNAEQLDRIVAVVNDAVITQSELTQMQHTIKKQLESNNVSLPPQEAFRKQVLDQMVNKKLQMQLAEQMGVNISDADVEKAIGMVAAGNKVSVSELLQKVVATGLSLKEYRKQIREELMLQQVQQHAVGSKLNITPQEVDDFMHSKSWHAYNSSEYHLEDILIALTETPTPQEVATAKKRAETLLAKIRGGLNFSQAAVAESGEHSALQGGDLGWRKLPEIPSAFANELIHMKANEILGPIQTPNGFHILRLAGIRNIAGHASAAQEREQVQQLIYQRKMEEGLQSWITKIRSEAFINTNPES